ncbi:MAG: RpiB/LacA/LacB family sugar-phosphate isomerase [Solirubrobacteraceae bacterium]
MRIAVGFDHAGTPLRDSVIETLRSGGHEPDDLGTCDDYPDIAVRVCAAVVEGSHERAVIVCGSGAGVAVAANKFHGIRATIAHDTYTGAQCVSHDDCNVICLGARVVGSAYAADIVAAFAAASFSGEERHVRRLAKVSEIERNGGAP